MKKIIFVFIFYFLIGKCFSQAGEWVWIKGSATGNQPGNFGVQGIPSPVNKPPSLYEACEWTDMNGNFWLFGGYQNSPYGALWKYYPATNEWTWMKGSNATYDPGNYGIQGVPSLLNNPPARSHGMVSWTDSLNNLWMFGGYNGLGGSFCDLWKYDISSNEWTWMKGPDTTNYYGYYGNQGIPSPFNNPGNRAETAAGWADNSGNLWLFGGANQSGGLWNDLEKYNIATNEWTWMKGMQVPNQPTVFGTQGIEDSLNTPGGRYAYCHWMDNDGNFWLFGGAYSSGGPMNDLWRYNPASGDWAWMGGNISGAYGTPCAANPSPYLPPARMENRVDWTDQSGNFWFFGGGGGANFQHVRNDLWKYCVETNEWVWVSGDNTLNPVGHWGTLGVSDPANKPNGRAGAVGWTDNNGHLYFFGGSRQGFVHYNDLWKYTIDTTCGVCPGPNSIQENNFTSELLVFPNPTNSSLTISFSSTEKQNIELRIYNTLGKQIYFSKEEITKGKFEKEIDVEKWSEGIYFLQVKMKERVLSKKMIVEHP